MATSRQPRPKNDITPCWTRQPWPHNLNQTVSGKAGAVHTADFYRYFDATPHAEFLFECVARTIDVELPAETTFLRIYDAFKIEVQQMIDMPDRLLDLLFRFLRQNQGRLSKRAREKEFSALSDAEAARIETIFAEIRRDAG
ncbi:hypothetical protein AB3G45_03945 [Shinella sp. S4-D37]|uniref:hypothetical protein n=1 Tax=Shinella sp. S4-D37 TaxID=3161999 RepID=UPI003466F042